MEEKVENMDMFEEKISEATDEQRRRGLYTCEVRKMPTFVCYDCAISCTLIIEDNDAPVPIHCPWGYERVNWEKSESVIYFKPQDLV